MVKNFFEYVKELVPEKGNVFFTGHNHSIWNAISLYKVADLLCGKKIKEAEYITAYSWNVKKAWDYPFDVIGLMFFKEGEEKWIHFSKNAFLGAICIVATRENITFDDEEHEALRQVWARKLENKETEEDKRITDLEDYESNFDDKVFAFDKSKKSIEKVDFITIKRNLEKVNEDFKKTCNIVGLTDENFEFLLNKEEERMQELVKKHDFLD